MTALSDTTYTCLCSGVEASYSISGRGPDLLYLHGAATLEGFTFLEQLTDRFRVIAPYHPGYAPGQEEKGLLGAQDLIVHYADLIETLGLDAPHVFGFSMGGWIASELAVFFGNRIGRIALVAPAGLRTPDIPAPDLEVIAPSDLPSYLAHDPEVAGRYFPGGQQAPSEKEFMADRVREAAAQQALEAPFGMGHPNMGRWLHHIVNPVKIYWGAQDRMVPPAYAARWKAHLPGAEICLLDQAGHLVMLERPDMLDDLASFLLGNDSTDLS